MIPPPLPEASAPPGHYRIAFNALPWLTANQRGGWQRYHQLIRDWRMVARYAARAGRVPALPGAHIIIELRFRANRRRDPGNWAPTAKAIVDGLVDAKVLPDDCSRYVIGPDLRLGPIAPHHAYGLVAVHLYPLAGR